MFLGVERSYVFSGRGRHGVKLCLIEIGNRGVRWACSLAARRSTSVVGSLWLCRCVSFSLE